VRLCRRFSFERDAFYAKRDFPAARAVVDWNDCVRTPRAFSAAAQEPSPIHQGLITTFAPIVEKVAPRLVGLRRSLSLVTGRLKLFESIRATRLCPFEIGEHIVRNCW